MTEIKIIVIDLFKFAVKMFTLATIVFIFFIIVDRIGIDSDVTVGSIQNKYYVENSDNYWVVVKIKNDLGRVVVDKQTYDSCYYYRQVKVEYIEGRITGYKFLKGVWLK